MSDAATPPVVWEAVRRVMADIGKVGVGKTGHNVQQGYNFRGIDAFVDALNPVLAQHGVVLLPNAGEPRITEHPTSKGGTQFMCVLRVEWTIVGPAGDTLSAVTVGQALDSSDKAANKAMSAAYKYALSQVFCVPNIGWAEQDTENPTVERQEPTQPAPDPLYAARQRAARMSLNVQPRRGEETQGDRLNWLRPQLEKAGYTDTVDGWLALAADYERQANAAAAPDRSSYV